MSITDNFLKIAGLHMNSGQLSPQIKIKMVASELATLKFMNSSVPVFPTKKVKSVLEQNEWISRNEDDYEPKHIVWLLNY